MNIVLPASATPCERFAAEELEKFIAAAALPDSSAAQAEYHLGRTGEWQARFASFPLGKLEPDGFAVKSEGNKLFIFGARDRGTLYGVYDFAEKVLGVRFVARDYTYIPPAHAASAAGLDYVSVPDIPLRSYRCLQIVEDPLFAARMRMVVTFGKEEQRYGGGILRDMYEVGHNTLSLIPPEKYFAEHPEFFSVRDGKPVDLCWSNGVTEDGRIDGGLAVSVPKLLAAAVIAQCEKNPELKFFTIAQEDSLGDFCSCPVCRARTEKYGAPSANILLCLGAVAEAVDEWAQARGREVNIVTYAYNNTERPPVFKDEKGVLHAAEGIFCHKNLYIKLCMSNADYAHSFATARQGGSYMHDLSYSEVFEGWKLLTDHFMFYDYGTNFYEVLWFYPNRKVLAENYRFYKKMGAAYVETECEHDYTAGFQPDLKCYVASKLLWNVNADADALMREFCRLYYGSAADAVLETIGILEDEAAAADAKFPEFSMHMFLEDWGRELDARYCSRAALERAVALLNGQLRQCADDAALKKRLQKVIVTPLRMLYKNAEAYGFTEAERASLRGQLKQNCSECGIEIFGGAVTLEKTGKSYGGTVKDL